MGSNLIIVVFAVVVIGGMGSILGSIFTGLGLGVIEGLTKVFYPEASATVVFLIMAIVLLLRPAGLFGRRNSMRRHGIVYLLGLALLLLAPLVVYPVLVMKVLCFALFACAFNLLLGYAGLLSFGHGRLSRFGCLRDRLRHDAMGDDARDRAAAGVAVAALLGAVFGALAIRRQGIYFAMITLALAQMVYFFCLQAPFTGGEDGLQGVPARRTARPAPAVRRLGDVLLRGGGVRLRLLADPAHHPLALRAGAQGIRENEPRALSLGYEVDRYKTPGFHPVDRAGRIGRRHQDPGDGFRHADRRALATSGEVVLMTLVGGVGTVVGPVIGAAIIIVLQNELADKVGPWVTVIMGVIFVACVLAFRRGIVGEIAARWPGKSRG